MSMFGNAETIETVKSGKRTAKNRTEFVVNGVQRYARVKATIVALTAIATTFENELKDTAFGLFTKLGGQTGTKPENFKGVEGGAKASMELRKRSTSSPLTDDEVRILSAADIPVTTEVSVTAMFGINPKYTGNMEVLAQIEKALTASGIAPEILSDLIVKQEEKSRTVVTDESVVAVFKNLQTKADIKETKPTAANISAYDHALDLVEMVTVPALKPTINEPMGTTVAAVLPLLLPTEKQYEVSIKEKV